jgi:hypothetical protein
VKPGAGPVDGNRRNALAEPGAEHGGAAILQQRMRHRGGESEVYQDAGHAQDKRRAVNGGSTDVVVPAVLQPSRRRQKEYRPLSSNLYRVLDATTAFNPLVFINVYWPR